jgi:hypothetical protein
MLLLRIAFSDLGYPANARTCQPTALLPQLFGASLIIYPFVNVHNRNFRNIVNYKRIKSQVRSPLGSKTHVRKSAENAFCNLDETTMTYRSCYGFFAWLVPLRSTKNPTRRYIS